MSIFSRCFVIVVVPVDVIQLPAWEPGPLPVTDGELVASAALRRGYFNERSAQALYGPGRLHRRMSAEHGFERSYDRLVVVGVELFGVPSTGGGRNALFAVHGEVHADGLELVETIARVADLGSGASAARSFLDELLEGCGSVMSGLKRATTITLATPAGLLEQPLESPAYDAWSAEVQWLWMLASATSAEDYLPPPENRAELLASIIRLSASWQALVLHDGVAFLGSGTDLSPAYRLSREGEFHFRTIYLDALLFAQTQRLQLTRIADELSALADPISNPAPLQRLERQLTAFRNVYWWQHLGPQWHANQLLRAYQAKHGITQLFEQSARCAQLSCFRRSRAGRLAPRTRAVRAGD